MPKHDITCPHCGGPVHRKALTTVAALDGLQARRFYCAPSLGGCSKYHLRHPETNELIVPPERTTRPARERKPKAPRPLVQTNVLDTILAALGVDQAALRFTAANSNGRPRALVNCLSDGDVAMLTPEDADLARYLHRQLLGIQAGIGVLRERSFKAAKETPNANQDD